VRTHAKVLDGFPRSPLALQQDGVGPSWCPQCELVEGDGLSTGSDDALLGSTGEPESSDDEFWNDRETDIVGYGSNDDDDFVSGSAALNLLSDTGKGDRGTVDLREEETAEDDFVKFGISTTGEEAVKLDKEEEVGILALGRCAMALFDVVVSNVDTHFAPES